jgi:superfamily II DNA helicase RecQ
LRIDRKELAARAAAEQWKLRKMVDYCYASGCLRGFILNYFGDRRRLDRCERCSTCARLQARISRGKHARTREGGTLALATGKRSPRIESSEVLDRFIIEEAPSGSRLRAELRKQAEINRTYIEDLHNTGSQTQGRPRNLAESDTIVVKKILSCVARLKGKFGKGTVGAVLRGSRSKQVLQGGLDKLTTYGLLREMSQDKINTFIMELVRANCIVISSGAYPTVRLTDFGREVMLGRAEVMLDLPDQ